MSADSSLSFFSKLKNKALYQVEKWVNDPDANQFMRENTVLHKGDDKISVKEAMEDIPSEAEAEKVATSNSPVIRVFQKMFYYTKRIISIAFFPFLAILFASLIANEMIIYPAPIRLVFFIFTVIICILSRVILTFIGIFYLCKWGFHYYINEMSDGPKRLIMPSLFALLPLTTKEYSNTFMNIIARPFQYGERWSVKDGEELQQRMNMYQTALDESFPYLQRIKTTEPFQTQHVKIETNFSELHKAFAPNTMPTPSATPSTVPSAAPSTV
jgi:hypothetical protein